MFRFKQFFIEQGRSAMKVCTDACIFGATVDPDGHREMLDIGTGTGLLSLMIAQRSACRITAVEIDPEACLDAVSNFHNSPFADRITLVKGPVQSYTAAKPGSFDLIVSNPPFYQNNLKSPLASKNAAHHDDTLDFADLIRAVDHWMTPEGSFWLLLPPGEMEVFAGKAGALSLFMQSRLDVRHQASKKIFRVVARFKRTDVTRPSTDELSIYEEDNTTYTPRFKILLKDYYTIF